MSVAERDLVNALVEAANQPLHGTEAAVALGLLVLAKWDRSREAGLSGPVDGHDIFTDREGSGYRESARKMLRVYTESIIQVHDNKLETVVNEALKKAKNGWWYGFWQNMAAALVWSLIIPGAVLLLKVSQPDLFFAIIKKAADILVTR